MYFCYYTVICYFICFVVQKLLSETQQNFQQQIKERQKYFQELEEAVETHKVCFEKKKNLWQLEKYWIQSYTPHAEHSITDV